MKFYNHLSYLLSQHVAFVIRYWYFPCDTCVWCTTHDYMIICCMDVMSVIFSVWSIFWNLVIFYRFLFAFTPEVSNCFVSKVSQFIFYFSKLKKGKIECHDVINIRGLFKNYREFWISAGYVYSILTFFWLYVGTHISHLCQQVRPFWMFS